MEFKDSKTFANLQAAFAGESMARNKYTYFASKAKKDGYEEIARIFEEIANNEKEHAKMWYKLYSGIGTTEENLRTAMEGEHYEWTDMYKSFAQIAKDEGFKDIALYFERVASIESYHEQRYQGLLENVKNNTVFNKAEETVWECLNCGHRHTGKNAPEKCPTCDHPKSYFKAE